MYPAGLTTDRVPQGPRARRLSVISGRRTSPLPRWLIDTGPNEDCARIDRQQWHGGVMALGNGRMSGVGGGGKRVLKRDSTRRFYLWRQLEGTLLTPCEQGHKLTVWWQGRWCSMSGWFQLALAEAFCSCHYTSTEILPLPCGPSICHLRCRHQYTSHLLPKKVTLRSKGNAN